MHAAALHLVPILGAEKSKVPFYIIAGALVVWAFTLSLVVGVRRENFPAQLGGERVVIAITAVLVIATVASDVLTSGGSTTVEAATPAVAPISAERPPPASTPAPSQGAPPQATTGTPAPPSSPAAGAVTQLKLAANPDGALSYNTKQLSAKAGKVTITMTNMSPIEHNVTIAQGSTVLGATPTFMGGSKVLTLSLKAGTYTFYCSVPGHRQAGMEGTLSVS